MKARLALTRNFAAVLALILVLDSCGSSSTSSRKPLTAAGLRAQLNSLCRQERNALVNQPGPLTPAVRQKITSSYLAKTKTLVPPRSLRMPFAQFVATIEQIENASQRHASTTVLLRLASREQALLAQLGFTRACGEGSG